MISYLQQITEYPQVRMTVTVLLALLVGMMWILPIPLLWAILCSALLPLTLYWQLRLYHNHRRKIIFLLDAIENNDNSIHFSEKESTPDNRLVNRALNRVARILYTIKSETAQQEKYYELILDCVNTGILVLNEDGAVYQKNNEVLRLLGLEVFTHVSQLSRIDARLQELIIHCRPGDKLQTCFSNERGTVNLSVRVSGITTHNSNTPSTDKSSRHEHLRILALNDINNELDEKEIDSWIRLTRVLTHEIMNAVTPITSLSDTLLTLTEKDVRNVSSGKEANSVKEVVADKEDFASKETSEEIRNGLQTISTTGKSLLSFVDNYRKFTRIPTPEPSLFYVKGFIERMVDLAHHQYPDVRICFQMNIVPDDLILYADENLVSQVLINILKNAIQAIESAHDENRNFSDEGVIRLRAYCNETEAILIEISNNGSSIPPEIAEHIFIPFFTTKEGGSGVGLSISRQIMRLSGGSLALLPGRETTFVLKFN